MNDSLPASELSRLRWRCRRGMRELDVLLTAWLESSYESAAIVDQEAFDRLLACEDDAIWDWMMGRAEPPDDLADLVQAIGQRHAEQRASY